MLKWKVKFSQSRVGDSNAILWQFKRPKRRSHAVPIASQKKNNVVPKF